MKPCNFGSVTSSFSRLGALSIFTAHVPPRWEHDVTAIKQNPHRLSVGG
jgi:hypothetical protein